MDVFTEQEISRLQRNLSVIRKIAGWSTADLGALIGVTKQTISNLENGKSKMSKAQYIAIRSVLDYEISSKPDNIALKKAVEILLNSDDVPDEEQEKIQNTTAFLTGATEEGLSNAAIMAGIIALLGISYAVSEVAGISSTIAECPKWLAKLLNNDRHS